MAVNFGNWQSFLDTSVSVLDCPSREKAFKRCRELQDYVQYIQKCRAIRDQDWIMEYFKMCKETRSGQKSTDISKKYRIEGNTFFKSNKNIEALEFYNKSVLHAPAANMNICENEEQDIALAFANRSAALYHLGRYELCLSDIRMALASGYPKRLKYKLLQREGQSFLACQLYDKAIEAIEEAVRSLDDADLSPTKKESVHMGLEDLLKKASGKRSQKESTREAASVSLPTPVNGCGSVLIQASSSVNLVINETKGRHLTASSDIAAGDVLIVEKPYAAVLLPHHYETQCHHCFGKLEVLFPCQQCVLVRYCSESCRQLSWTSYHSLECPFMDLFHSIGIAHLSLRIIISTGIKGLLDFHKEYIQNEDAKIGEASLKTGLTKDNTYKRSYLSVFALMPHADDLEPRDLFQYGMTACLLLECLEQGQFFSSFPSAENVPKGSTCIDDSSAANASEEPSAAVTEIISHLTDIQIKTPSSTSKALDSYDKVKLYVGGLLLRHICQLICNAHAITALHATQTIDFSLVETTSQVRIATAIYPTASLLNHSCEPTIISSFQNEVLVVRAVKNVKAGEEIFNCYGPHHKRMPYAERQLNLKLQYFFDCVCPACQSQGKQDEIIKALRCPKCSGPMVSPDHEMTCMDCGETSVATSQMKAVLISLDILLDGCDLMNKGDYKGALVKLTKCLKMREEAMYKHNKDLAEVQDAAARCLSILGDYNKAADLLKKSVRTTEVIYGETSIELGNELQKYAEVLFQAGLLAHSKFEAERAISIFEINYGASSESVAELNNLLSMIAQQSRQ